MHVPKRRRIPFVFIIILAAGAGLLVRAQNPPPNAQTRQRDAVAEAQRPAAVKDARVEQNKNAHDRSTAFDARNAQPNSTDVGTQPKQGRISGFDFYRDPLNADRPFQTFEEIMKTETANRPKVMAAQRKLLESRYNLQPKLDPEAKMSRGKPLLVGPTARLAQGVTWEQLAQMSPADIRQRDAF